MQEENKSMGTIDYEISIKIKLYEAAYVFCIGLFFGSICSAFAFSILIATYFLKLN
jgi:hypothetical protein